MLVHFGTNCQTVSICNKMLEQSVPHVVLNGYAQVVPVMIQIHVSYNDRHMSHIQYRKLLLVV